MIMKFSYDKDQRCNTRFCGAGSNNVTVDLSWMSSIAGLSVEGSLWRFGFHLTLASRAAAKLSAPKQTLTSTMVCRNDVCIGSLLW
jgi:hypothetical protein